MNGSRAAVAALLVNLWLAGAVRASETSAERRVQAQQLFRSGQASYQDGHYDLAIKDFLAAFRIVPLPGLLFNLAQAYRLAGDCPHSLYYYQRYQGVEPNAPNIHEVQARIAQMAACASAPPTPSTPAARVSPTPVPSPATRTSPPEPELRRRALTRSLEFLIPGAIVTGVGVWASAQALSDARSVSSFSRTGGIWTGAITTTAAQGKAAGVAGPLLLGVGLACTAYGVFEFDRYLKLPAVIVVSPGAVAVAFSGAL